MPDTMADTTKLHTKHQMHLMTYAAELLKRMAVWYSHKQCFASWVCTPAMISCCQVLFHTWQNDTDIYYEFPVPQNIEPELIPVVLYVANFNIHSHSDLPIWCLLPLVLPRNMLSYYLWFHSS